MSSGYIDLPETSGGGGGSGTVTSVAIAAPSSTFNISGSPVTTAGTLSLSYKAQVKNLVFSGPATGANAAPTFRALVAADLPFALGDLTDAGVDGIVVAGGSGAVIGSGTSLAQHVADATHNGYLSSTDWVSFNAKQPAITPGDLTDVGTDGIVITGGSGSVIGAGTSIAQHVSDATHNGYLSSADWVSFNAKLGALTIGSLDSQTANANGLAFVGGALSTQSATSTRPGMVNNTSQTFSGAKTFTGNVIVDTNTLYVDASAHKVGVGTAAPAARLDSLSTTEQLRLSYDATHYTTFTVDSAGTLTVAPTLSLALAAAGTVTLTGAGGMVFDMNSGSGEVKMKSYSDRQQFKLNYGAYNTSGYNSSFQFSSATSDTVANGFGIGLTFFAGTALNNSDKTMTRITSAWVDANYASVSSKLAFETIYNDGALTEQMSVDPKGNIIVGTAALTTTATDGFLYIPSCAGTPTGTPTAATGRVPMVFDSSNSKFYIYTGGAWKSVTLT